MSTIALLHPGEMGAAVGKCLVEKGERVVYAAAGRSPESVARARAAGLVDAGTLAQALDGAEMVLSIVPPASAADVAEAVLATGWTGLYVDANAIAPSSTRDIGHRVLAAGGHFVDGGIIGPPPAAGRASRLYLCGGGAGLVKSKFLGTPMEAIVLDGGIGAASAIKACFAAWSKGSTALLAAIRALAHAEGVEAALLDEWRTTLPDLPKRSENVTVQAYKAWRWIGEMEEIARSFEAAGLPGGFHHASADVYRALETFRNVQGGVTMAEVLAALVHRPADR